MRPGATTRWQEKGVTEDPNRPLRNVFDRLGRDRREDMRTHLDARRALVISKRRQEEAVVSPVNDEINELRARLKKLAARNTEAAQSTSTSSFSVEIQQAPLLVGFRMPTIAVYEGKTDPLDHLDAFNGQMDLLQVILLAHCRCFTVTLSGTTKKQIRQIELETINSWGQLSTMFMRQF